MQSKIKSTIEDYKLTDSKQWKLVALAWDKVHEMTDFEGGSYKDALKKCGLYDAWNKLEQHQLKQLSELGVERFYDEPVHALEYALKIAEYLSSRTSKTEDKE